MPPRYYLDMMGNVVFDDGAGPITVAGPPGKGIRSPIDPGTSYSDSLNMFDPQVGPDGVISPTIASIPRGDPALAPPGPDAYPVSSPSQVQPAAETGHSTTQPQRAPDVAPAVPVAAAAGARPDGLSPDQAAVAEMRAPARSADEALALASGTDLVTTAGTLSGITRETDADVAAAQAQAAGDDEQARWKSEEAAILQRHEAELIAGNKERVAKRQKDIDAQLAAVEEVGKESIDPGRFWRSRDTHTKLAVTLGAVAQGFLTLRGLGQGNAVIDSLEKAVARDIDAQAANINQKNRTLAAKGQLYDQMYQLSGDSMQAKSLAMAAGLNAIASQAEAAKARTSSEVGKANLEGIRAKAQIKANQFLQAAADARTEELRNGEKHNIEKARARAELDLINARRQSLLMKAGGGAGKAPPPPSAGYLGLAKARFPNEKMSTDLIVTGPGLTDGYHVVGTEKEKDKIQDVLSSVDPIADEIDKLRALILESGAEAPGTEARVRMEALQARMVSAVRVPGEGAITEGDATRFSAQIAKGVESWMSLKSPKDAEKVLNDLQEFLQNKVNARIQGADPFKKETVYTIKSPRTEAYKGRGAKQDPSETARGAITKVRLPSEVDVGPSRSSYETEVKKEKQLNADGELLIKEFSPSSVKAAVAGFQRGPGTPEYEKSGRYLDVLREKHAKLNSPEVLQLLATDSGKYKEYRKGISYVFGAMAQVEKAFSDYGTAEGVAKRATAQQASKKAQEKTDKAPIVVPKRLP